LEQESKRQLALEYYKAKVLSLGRAAEFAGLSKWDFIDFLSENDVPVIDYDEDELVREFETAARMTERLRK